jgi:hypothetical protein
MFNQIKEKSPRIARELGGLGFGLVTDLRRQMPVFALSPGFFSRALAWRLSPKGDPRSRVFIVHLLEWSKRTKALFSMTTS